MLEVARGHQIDRLVRHERHPGLGVNPRAPGSHWLLRLLKVFPSIEVGVGVHQLEHGGVPQTGHHLVHLLVLLAVDQLRQLLCALLGSLEACPPEVEG